MSPDVLRVVLAVVLVMHGLGHVLFLGPALRLVDWAGQTGGSWLISAPLGDGPTHALGGLVWAASTVLFVVSAGGLLVSQEWWRPVALAGAVVSLFGIAVFWDGIATTSAAFALVVDVAIIVALAVIHWPSVEAVGA